MGRADRFDNWYKRRLSRILPSIISIAIVAAFVSTPMDVIDILAFRKYWFVSCILIYYILLYPIKMYGRHLMDIFCGVGVLILIAYILFFDYNDNGIIYGAGNFRLLFFFLFILQGAIIGKNFQAYTFHKYDIVLWTVCLISWYGIIFYLQKSPWQVISLVPLLGITYYSYKIACAPLFSRLYHQKYIGRIIFCTATLCLDAYLVQKYIITDRLNGLFPFNIPMIMLSVLVAAYGVRVMAEIIGQTFNDKPYNWHKIFCMK